MRRSYLAAITATIFFLLLFVFPNQKSYAHAALVRTDPPDNAILDEMPEQMHLWFNEGINADFSTFKILDISGEMVPLAGIQRDESDDKHIILSMPEMGEGVYSIHWEVLSAYDGHDTRGFVVLGIGAGVDLSTVDTISTAEEIPWFEVILRWLNYSLLALLTGALIVRTAVLRPQTAPDSLAQTFLQADISLVRWASYFALGAIIAGFLLLLQQILQLLGSLPENATIPGIIWLLLTNSRWGLFWIGRQILAVLLSIFWFWNRRNPSNVVARTSSFYLILFTIGINLTQVFNGHAATVEEQLPFVITADLLHLLAVGAWLGGLGILALVLLPQLRHKKRAEFKSLVRAGWRPFGLIAAISVLVLFLTGIYSAGHQIASPDAWVKTVYGQTLLGKIGLMLLMGLFGLCNAMLLHPRLAAPLARLLRKPTGWTPFSLRHFPRLLTAELLFAAAVILSVGVITALPNPRGPEFAPYPKEHLLSSITIDNQDMLVSFSAKPNVPGQNVFIVRATSMRRPAPSEIMRVFLRYTYLEDDIGTITVDAQDIGDAQYHLGGSYFSLPGEWLVEVIVRRKGVEDVVSEFFWTVPPTTEPPAILISDQPLQPWTTAVSLTGAFTFAVLVLLSFYRRRNATAHNVAASAAPISSIMD